jgi:hypothetical protein
MKHLKRFNENNDSFAEQLKDFCETNLAYLLDDGGKVQIYHDKIVIISLEEPKDWSHIKDQMIPFLTRLSGKYELNNKYYSTKEKKNAEVRIDTNNSDDSYGLDRYRYVEYEIEDLIEDNTDVDSIGEIESIRFNVNGYKQPKKSFISKIKSYFK